MYLSISAYHDTVYTEHVEFTCTLFFCPSSQWP